MANGLSIIVPGPSSFSPSNVIASIFPKPGNLRDLVLYGSAGPRKVFGQIAGLPSRRGSPTIKSHSFVGSADGNGYTTVVPDETSKVVAILSKWPEGGAAAGSMAAGVYRGGPSNQGDQLFFHEALGQLRVAASTSGSNTTSTLDGVKAATGDGKFYLFVGTWTGDSVRGRYVKNDAVVASPVTTVTARATALPQNIRIADTYQAGGFVYQNRVEVAASAIWTGTDLTNDDLLTLRAWFAANLGDDIDIGA